MIGNVYGYQQQNIPSNEVWLQNQLFRIKGQYYSLSDRRGGGSFGSVWASTMPDGRRAAVKIFDLRRIQNIPAPVLIKSFKDEVKMAHRLRDAKSHVVNIFGFDFDPQRSVGLLAMELGDETLESRVKNLHSFNLRNPIEDFISAKDRKNIWLQLVQILFVLNQHNIVHRDMKPANLVFFGPTLKLVDLGIAQKTVQNYHQKQSIGGTPYFSAPECFQLGLNITSKADIWSAGAILYYLTYGHEPRLGNSQPIPGKQRTQSNAVNDMMYHCLQRHQSKRANHQWIAEHPYTSTQVL